MANKRRQILTLAVAILGTVGFVGPLLFTLFSIFTNPEQTQAPSPTPNATQQEDPAVVLQQVAGYEQVLKREPDNANALANLASLRLRQGQFNQAIPLVEKLAQKQPENPELRLQLAQLYLITGQAPKAESAYTQVLSKDKNNVDALVGKATLRQTQGDTKTAKALFDQAEKTAPADLKAKVREVAKNTLTPPAKPTPVKPAPPAK